MTEKDQRKWRSDIISDLTLHVLAAMDLKIANAIADHERREHGRGT